VFYKIGINSEKVGKERLRESGELFSPPPFFRRPTARTGLLARAAKADYGENNATEVHQVF
ncbi:MAG: hypothetical protein JW810_12995, partial [Sedimentisphaerales bacterium]|nr:hypothetical protein [Sedimentisphaerales bacterium]